jgi:ribonuclease III family protein
MTLVAEKLSPLALAYIGDAVYELAVREYLLEQTHAYNKELHRQTVELVRAECQSDLYERVAGLLDAQEQAVLRRGRNARSGHQPPHASVAAYRRATGVETLIGWLYLKGEKEKLDLIFGQLFESKNKEQKK